MDSEIDIESARALTGNGVLWPRVRDFLWNFAPQVHPERLEAVVRGIPGAVRDGESAGAAVSLLLSTPRSRAFVLERLGVEPFFHDFPQDGWSRLALLDGATLESLAAWLGAVACAGALRRVTDGASVRALKAGLPDVYPAVFGYTAYFPADTFAAPGADSAKTPENVLSAGAGLLFSLFGDCPAPLAARVALKLPERLCGLRGGKGDGRSAPGAAVKKLLKLRFPEAYRLCSS